MPHSSLITFARSFHIYFWWPPKRTPIRILGKWPKGIHTSSGALKRIRQWSSMIRFWIGDHRIHRKSIGFFSRWFFLVFFIIFVFSEPTGKPENSKTTLNNVNQKRSTAASYEQLMSGGSSPGTSKNASPRQEKTHRYKAPFFVKCIKSKNLF